MHGICRCEECLSTEDAACIFGGGAFVNHAGGDPKRRWTHEVLITELDSGMRPVLASSLNCSEGSCHRGISIQTGSDLA